MVLFAVLNESDFYFHTFIKIKYLVWTEVLRADFASLLKIHALVIIGSKAYILVEIYVKMLTTHVKKSDGQ